MYQKFGAKALKSIDDFKDNFVFQHKDTNKNLLMYCEEQQPFTLVDDDGVEFEVTDKSGCCILPDTYTLGNSLEYADLISDNSSNRAIYKEE